MQAQPFNTGLPAIAVAHNTTTAQPSSANAASATPSISQQPCDRWTDLPVEVVEQVMYWSMLQSGSSISATSFALTSKYFAQAGQSFRTSLWYQEARSMVMHDRTVNWTYNFVKMLGYFQFTVNAGNLAELNLALKNMGRAGEGRFYSLQVAHPAHAETGTDYLDSFRNFQGAELSLLMGVLEQTRDRVIEIARVLPANVCLYVELSFQVSRQRVEDLGVASLVSRVAMSGRPTAFNLRRHADLSTCPDELGAVLDVACGPGMVSFLHFGRTENPDAMLRALCDRVHRFRDLKLVIFDCERAPTRDSLSALVAALEKRNSAAQLRLTVAINCCALRAGSANAAPLFSADELASYEHAGLYFERLEFGTVNIEGEQKVLSSIVGPPVHAVLLQSQMVDAEQSSDSDVLIESSDSEPLPDSSDLPELSSEEDIGQQQEPPEEGTAHGSDEPDERTERRSRKRDRDRCVIS